ncbi:hypothetical protein ACTFJJ_20820, partial [Enterobacter roggenkampii]|uniref:hypothetical protein n=1 Tax=Enterobacter roggenkampii TaxID=1812935 RepID=UPI003F762042
LMKTLLTSGCTNQRGAGHCLTEKAGTKFRRYSVVPERLLRKWLKILLLQKDDSQRKVAKVSIAYMDN